MEERTEDSGFESDNESRPFECAFCEFSSTDFGSIAAHFRDKHYKLPDDKFPCQNCDFTCNAYSEWKAHNRANHYRKGIFCEKCDFPCPSADALREHFNKVHLNKRYVCYYCGLARTYKARLRRHMVNRHIEPKDFVVTARKSVAPKQASGNGRCSASLSKPAGNKLTYCSKCPFKTTSQSKFSVHQRSHAEPDPGSVGFSLTCNECPFETGSVLVLRDHVKTHIKDGSRVFQCAQCSYKSSKLADLIAHENRHKQPPTFNCNLCNFRCNKMNQLKTHKLKHKAAEEPLSSDNEKENKFFCTQETCNFKCSRLADLADHSEIVHRSDSVFECTQCDFSCMSLSRLTEHEASHQNRVRVYSCEHCPYEVTSYVAFRKHAKIHEPEKAFDCNYCDFACGSLNELLKHQLAHVNTASYEF